MQICNIISNYVPISISDELQIHDFIPIFAFSKFFSTRVNLHLRFDDAASHGADLMSRIQVNQLLSFGFEMNI